MKKGKLLSILTSLAMTSSMVLSAVPSTTASAAAANPLGLQLTSEKTSFSLDEIKAGQSATVYVDATGPISESDKVGSVEFKLKSSAWGKVDPVDLYLCDPNVLETSKGSQPKKAYNATGTMVISKWEGTKPSKVGYALQDYASVGTFSGYSDDYMPSVILISDSTKGFLKTGTEGQHIAQFNVNFPKDLAEGTYTISFVDAKSMICVDGEFGSNNSEMAAAPAAKSITFTVGSGQGPANPDPVVTNAPNPSQGEVVISENPVVKDSDKTYDADATLKGGVVKAKAGETVDVPVYLELGANADPKYITGIGFKVEYDKSALELADMSDGDGFVSDGGFNSDTGTGVFLFTFTTEDIEIDPSKPIGTLTFNVKSGVADGTYRVHLTNHLNGDTKAVQIIHTQNPGKDATYYVPHVTDGAVVVGAGGSNPTTAEPSPSDIDKNRIYDGDATLKGETVKAKAGETVDVPVYLELGANVDPKFITGIGFKAVYDTSALQLTDISDGDGFISDGGFNADTGTGVFLFTFTTEDIQIDPTKPIATFTFKVSGNASGSYPVKLVNHLFGEEANIQIVHTQYPQKEATYLKPTVVNGAVVIDGGSVETTLNNVDGNRIYDGDANLKVDTVKANAGETVDVPVYLELGANVDPKYITGIGFKVVYDKSALELVDMTDSDGFLSDGGFNCDTETGVFLYTFTTEDIEIDPTKPIGVLTFKVKDGVANGTYKVELINHLFDGANIQIIHTQYPQKDATYLTPHLTNGAVIVGDTVITTAEPQPGPVITDATTTANDVDKDRIYDGDANLKAETVKAKAGEEVKVPVYLELGANVDPKYITGIGFKVVYDKNALELVDISDGDGFISDGGFNADTETGVFLYTFTTEDIEIDPTKPIGYFTFKVKDGTANGTYPVELINHLFGPTAKIQIIHTQYPQKAATYLTPHVTNGAVIVGDVAETTPAPQPGPGEETTPYQPGPVQTEVVTSIVTQYVTIPGETVTSIVTEYVTVPVVVTSIVYETVPAETVTVTVPVYVEGSTTPNAGPQPTGKVSISIADNENHWYFADENSWNLSQVKVYVDGNETNVSASDLKFSVGGNSNATPSNTYQKGTFDYKVTVSYQDATAEFTAKIGQRGDANCDHDVNVRDAAAIAKDLASLIKNNNKTALTKEGGFGVFLGNADGGQGGKEAYAPYDLTVRDAAVIAKFLSQKVAHPEQTLKDLAVK